MSSTDIAPGPERESQKLLVPQLPPQTSSKAGCCLAIKEKNLRLLTAHSGIFRSFPELFPF